MRSAIFLAGVAIAGLAFSAQAQVVPPSNPNGIACAYNSSVPAPSSGQAFWVQCDSSGNLRVTSGGASADASAAVTSASSTTAGSNLVLKASAGNLYSITVTIGATGGYLMLFDATSLPVNGAVTPVWCGPVATSGVNGMLAIEFAAPKSFATGITAGFSTTGCFTLTASATAAFFGGYK